MLHTAEIDIVNSVKPSDINIFSSDAVCAICSTYHTVLKSSSGSAIIGQDMLFDIPFLAEQKKIREHRQRLTDHNTAQENESRIDYDYQVGQKVLVGNNCIIRKSESRYLKEPQTIMSVIQMEQSGFNARTNLKGLISRE